VTTGDVTTGDVTTGDVTTARSADNDANLYVQAFPHGASRARTGDLLLAIARRLAG
jgi:hypothetical protein